MSSEASLLLLLLCDTNLYIYDAFWLSVLWTLSVRSSHPPGDKHSSYSMALGDVLGLTRSRGNGCKYATFIREVEPSFKMEFDVDRWVQLFGGLCFFVLPVIHPGLVDAERYPSGPCNFGWPLVSWELEEIPMLRCSPNQQTLSLQVRPGLECFKMAQTTVMDNWIWDPLTSSTDLQILVFIRTTEEKTSSPNYGVRWFWCKTMFANHRFTRKEFVSLCPGCFPPPSPISNSCPGYSHHHISWLKCDGVNWSNDISN